jgi:hypothetical protein
MITVIQPGEQYKYEDRLYEFIIPPQTDVNTQSKMANNFYLFYLLKS